MDEELNELYHSGRKGMKWGQHIFGRRYQSRNGKLNRAGQKRYDREMSKLKKEKAVLRNKQRTAKKIDKLDTMKSEVNQMKKEYSSPKQTQTRLKPKTVKEMSNAELNEKILRAQLEQRYKELTSPTQQNKIFNGKQFVANVLKKSGDNIATQLTTYMMGKAVNKAFANVFDDPKIVNPKKGQKDK